MEHHLSQASKASGSKKQISGSNHATKLILHYENHPLVQGTLGKNERSRLGVFFPLLTNNDFVFSVSRQPITLESGANYDGEWKNGLRDGLGKQTWPDGSIYEGEWINDKSHGKGKLIHADGDIYEGDWTEDKANGKGNYQHVNGAKYEGDVRSMFFSFFKVEE